jgi:C_GCAxxG_C_C family probable redox protein
VDTGLPKEARKMATGFGGGIGLFGDSCGALIGAVMAVSAVHEITAPHEGEGATIRKAGFVPLVQSDSQSTKGEVQ